VSVLRTKQFLIFFAWSTYSVLCSETRNQQPVDDILTTADDICDNVKHHDIVPLPVKQHCICLNTTCDVIGLITNKNDDLDIVESSKWYV